MKMQYTLTVPLLSGILLFNPWPTALPVAHAQHDHDHEHAEENDHDHGHEANHDEHEHTDHADHDHGEHGHDESVVQISPEVLEEFGIEVETAGNENIEQTLWLPGEVVYNADRIAHVTPTVAGIVKQVNFSVGDHAEKGQIMAVLNSRELAAARSAYLAAEAKLTLDQANLEREERLLEEKVGTQRAVLASRQAFEESQIALNQAENALHALGYSHEQIGQIESLDETDFNTYELLAPITGIVTQRHLTIGEVIEPSDDGSPFVVADLATVWVNLTVYQRDLAKVKPGQNVSIHFGHGIPDAHGEIAFVSPALDETTRTATARIILPNPDGHWRPGLFVSGEIDAGGQAASVAVPRTAITKIDDETVVFVQTDEGFEPRIVQLGQTTEQRAEIVDGLTAGERYAIRNVLALKAELNRAALEHAGHSH